MNPYIVTLVVIVVYAALKAAQDKTNDHWDHSVFFILSKGDLTAWFGHRDYVWIRRHEGKDDANPKLWPFRIPVLSNMLEAVWDFFHLAGTLRVGLFLGLGCYLGWAGAVFSLQQIAAFPFVYMASFELFYRVLYTRRLWGA